MKSPSKAFQNQRPEPYGNRPIRAPHSKGRPNDADLLADWVPDENTRKRVLVDNSLELYGR
jgi:hypothetical protein